MSRKSTRHVEYRQIRRWSHYLIGNDGSVRFRHTRLVVRYGIHPLIEELYPRHTWEWRELTGRNQANSKKPEVLIVRNAA